MKRPFILHGLLDYGRIGGKGGGKMNTELTKGSEKLLCEIYAEYLKRVKNGIAQREARNFTDKIKWPNPEWDTTDYQERMIELNRSGMIKRYLRGSFILENPAVSFMENRFKNGLTEVLDWISKFI